MINSSKQQVKVENKPQQIWCPDYGQIFTRHAGLLVERCHTRQVPHQKFTRTKHSSNNIYIYNSKQTMQLLSNGCYSSDLM